MWQSAVADITAEVSDVTGLLKNLAGVKRNVAPTTHATVLLMPSQAFMKTVLEQTPDISNAELVAVMSHHRLPCSQDVCKVLCQWTPTESKSRRHTQDSGGGTGLL